MRKGSRIVLLSALGTFGFTVAFVSMAALHLPIRFTFTNLPPKVVVEVNPGNVCKPPFLFPSNKDTWVADANVGD